MTAAAAVRLRVAERLAAAVALELRELGRLTDPGLEESRVCCIARANDTAQILKMAATMAETHQEKSQ